MQHVERDIEGLISNLVLAQVPAGMEARILCSCRTRLFEVALSRGRNVAQLAVVCAIANMAFATIALRVHRQHVRIKRALYGSEGE
jgi:hypothetical protein